MVNIITRLIFGLFLMGLGAWGLLMVKGALHDSWFYKKPSLETNFNVVAEPLLDANINLQKILTLTNNGIVPLSNVKIFATKYTLEEKSFTNKQILIKDRNKIGGAIKTIENIPPKGNSIQIDLKTYKLLHFFENPGKNDNTPILTYYCFRISYRDSITSKTHFQYKTISSYKDFPSFVDNQELTAIAGTWGDFMLDLPRIIKEDQIKLFNDNP